MSPNVSMQQYLGGIDFLASTPGAEGANGRATDVSASIAPSGKLPLHRRQELERARERVIVHFGNRAIEVRHPAVANAREFVA